MLVVVLWDGIVIWSIQLHCFRISFSRNSNLYDLSTVCGGNQRSQNRNRYCVYAYASFPGTIDDELARRRETHTYPATTRNTIDSKASSGRGKSERKEHFIEIGSNQECRVWVFVAAAACLPAVGTCIERIRLFFLSINPCSEYCTYSTDSPDSSKDMCQIGGM